MANIVTKAGKGAPLSHNELDANWTNLNTEKVERDGSIPFTGDIDAGGNAVTNVGNVDGRDVSADGTKLDTVASGADANPPDASQVEAEAGTETATRLFSPLRIFQAIAARLTQTVNMAGAKLHGHSANGVELVAATDLNITTHLGSVIDIQNNTFTVKTQATVTYVANQQGVVWSSHASGGTFTVDAGVTLNGVDGGSITINQNEAYSFYRKGENNWWVFNGDVA